MQEIQYNLESKQKKNQKKSKKVCLIKIHIKDNNVFFVPNALKDLKLPYTQAVSNFNHLKIRRKKIRRKRYN